jgi:hypothetical protein
MITFCDVQLKYVQGIKKISLCVWGARPLLGCICCDMLPRLLLFLWHNNEQRQPGASILRTFISAIASSMMFNHLCTGHSTTTVKNGDLLNQTKPRSRVETRIILRVPAKKSHHVKIERNQLVRFLVVTVWVNSLT